MINIKKTALKLFIILFEIIFIQNVYAVQLVVDSQNKGNFTIPSDALNYIYNNQLTTPEPQQIPSSGNSATIWKNTTLVQFTEDLSNFSTYTAFTDGLLIKFSGDEYWYSAKYLTNKSLTLLEKSHKSLDSVSWKLAVKTPYEVYIRNGKYIDSGEKPIAPFVTIRGESKRGATVDTNGGGAMFKFSALCKEATLMNFSIIPSGPGKGGSVHLTNNPDNNPYVNWVLNKMYIDVHNSENVDTIAFFDQEVNTITIEDSYIEGNYHVLPFFNTTGAVIRNNTIVAHTSGNSWSTLGILMYPSKGANILIEDNEFITLADEFLSPVSDLYDNAGIYIRPVNNSIWNGTILRNTIRVSSINEVVWPGNEERGDLTSGIRVVVPDNYDGSPVWQVLIDNNTIEVDSRSAQACHVNSEISINAGSILQGDEQAVIKCGLAY